MPSSLGDRQAFHPVISGVIDKPFTESSLAPLRLAALILYRLSSTGSPALDWTERGAARGRRELREQEECPLPSGRLSQAELGGAAGGGGWGAKLLPPWGGDGPVIKPNNLRHHTCRLQPHASR